MNETKANIKNKFLTILGRIGITLLISVFGILILAYSVFFVLCHGPSESAMDLFVTSCMETSFARYFPMMVLSSDEIDEIMKRNSIVETKESTDASLVVTNQNEKQPDIEIVDVKRSNFRGYMAIIKDPSRVRVAAPDRYGASAGGKFLLDMINDEGGILGINAGGFEDDGGNGNGGTPLGIVIKDGKLAFGNLADHTCVIGFDKDNVLHVGNMTAQQALDKELRDAVSFGPVLVVNGKPAGISGSSGGLNPRTAIGQRADGSVLMLVIDGRQPHSAGASCKDLIEVMLEFDAVNAGNLDGGSSTMMYYKGEMLNICASIYGARKLPTSFVVV